MNNFNMQEFAANLRNNMQQVNSNFMNAQSQGREKTKTFTEYAEDAQTELNSQQGQRQKTVDPVMMSNLINFR